MNISSLVVHVRPEQVAAVRAELSTWPGVEVPAAAPDGRLVVTVETTTDRESSECFTRIGTLPGVMSVALVYHQFEPEPDTGFATGSTDAPEEARHDC
ncbi:MAG: chaperone NapD [Burkholderiales bacterium]|nr:chaperone NapD [Burkholderiales bacterium]